MKYLPLFLLIFFCFLIAPRFAMAIEVRPEDYGAIVDDGQDDTAAIQAAVDAVLQARGGTIIFPSGKLEIRNTINFVPSGYIGSDILLKGNKSSLLEVSVGASRPAFYGGNLTTWTFEDLAIAGKNVPANNPSFIDAAAVIFSNYVEQTNIIRCNLFGLAVPNGSGVLYFGFTDAKVEDSQLNGNVGLYPDGAVIMAENTKGLSVLRSSFLDYGNYQGSYFSKSPEFVGAWVRVKSGAGMNATGERRIVIEDSRFDEGAANAIRIENATWARIRGISVNVSGTDPGVGLYLNNVEDASVERSWFGYTSNARPAIFANNVDVLSVESLKLSGGVYFLQKQGAGLTDVKNCPDCKIDGQTSTTLKKQ